MPSILAPCTGNLYKCSGLSGRIHCEVLQTCQMVNQVSHKAQFVHINCDSIVRSMCLTCCSFCSCHTREAQQTTAGYQRRDQYSSIAAQDSGIRDGPAHSAGVIPKRIDRDEGICRIAGCRTCNIEDPRRRRTWVQGNLTQIVNEDRRELVLIKTSFIRSS